jgi:hypothetical protein
VIAAMSLEDACQYLLSEGFDSLLHVAPATVQSRAASEEVLKVLHHLT